MLLLLFNQGAATFTGTLAVTDAKDVVAFSGDFPVFGSFAITDAKDMVSMTGIVTHVGWVAAIKQAETWTGASTQNETWTPAVKQSETWTVH